MSKEVLKFDPENWDWYAYLDASKEIKENFFLDAAELAGAWTTCACGQFCDVLPKNLDSSPEDIDAFELGLQFYECIKQEDWYEAKITLDKIEKRTAFLLNQPNYIDPKTL